MTVMQAGSGAQAAQQLTVHRLSYSFVRLERQHPLLPLSNGVKLWMLPVIYLLDMLGHNIALLALLACSGSTGFLCAHYSPVSSVAKARTQRHA